MQRQSCKLKAKAQYCSYWPLQPRASQKQTRRCRHAANTLDRALACELRQSAAAFALHQLLRRAAHGVATQGLTPGPRHS
eukprot:3050309-Pleurochrysis_carterae.AAC.2